MSRNASPESGRKARGAAHLTVIVSATRRAAKPSRRPPAPGV